MLCHAPDRVEEALDPERERDEESGLNLVLGDHLTAHDDSPREREGHEHLGRRHEGGGQTRGPQVCLQVRGVELVELDHVPLLAAHALDDAHAGEVSAREPLTREMAIRTRRNAGRAAFCQK